MKLRKFGRAKRLRRSKEGVHSLIGDFLVLAITILLLSGIFMYVMALPPPDDTTYVDFDPAIPVVVQTHSNNDLRPLHQHNQLGRPGPVRPRHWHLHLHQ